jgi:hypothetical protein
MASTTFEQTVEQDGEYLWNNASNWTAGVPVSGDAVTADSLGYDNIASLDLASLTLGGSGEVNVLAGSELTIGSVEASTYGSVVSADTLNTGGSATVTIGTVSDLGWNYYAEGAGATVVAQSFSTTGGDGYGNNFTATDGGMIVLDAAPVYATSLYYEGAGTIALEDPAASTSEQLSGVAPGDVLELPGTSVSSVTFGTDSLDVTTSAGTYDFTDVSYAGSVTSWIATMDPSTGLEAIAFGVADTFQQSVAVGAEYRWSSASNWTTGVVPVSGDAVTADSLGYDNIASLDLASLTLGGSGAVNVLGGNELTIGSVEASTYGGVVSADMVDQGATGDTATVTIGTVSDLGWNYYADGAGATVVAESFITTGGDGYGNNFTATDGGMIVLDAAPVYATSLYYEGAGTVALEDPAASTSEQLAGVAPGDVLELPGTSVSSVTIGTDSLDITTSAGTYDFTDVSYASSVTSWAATIDPSTGLEAIAFGVADTFQQSVAVGAEYRWDNASNWTTGVAPVSGDAVTADSAGYDNIASLDLASLTLGGSGAVSVLGGNELTIGSVEASTGGGIVAADMLDQGATGDTATVTIGTVSDLGWNYYAEGTGATLVAESFSTTGGDGYGNNFTAYDGGTIVLDASPVYATSLYYEDGTGTIALKDPAASTSEQLSGVAPGDVLELPGTSVSSVTFGQNSLDITTSAGTYDFTNVNYASSVGSYTAAVDPSTGLEAITFEPVCFLRGTRIRTVAGEKAVEDLTVGECVLTASGQARPIRWIGSRGLDCTSHPKPDFVWPVRIQSGAFAEDLPVRDLWVSPFHSILVEGVLIQVERLVNGATIVQLPRERVEYWHVELDSHDILLAEGLPAESYLDVGNRAAFVNGGDYLEAYPDFAPKDGSETCVPLVKEGPVIGRARAALLARAEVLGYALTEDPDLHILADGRRIDPVRLNERRVAFMLPAAHASIELRCRRFTPAQMNPSSDDVRSLGICVERLQLDGADMALADEAAFAEAWHPLERSSSRQGQPWRWSQDRMPLPVGTRLLVIDLCHQGAHYWMKPASTLIALFG